MALGELSDCIGLPSPYLGNRNGMVFSTPGLPSLKHWKGKSLRNQMALPNEVWFNTLFAEGRRRAVLSLSRDEGIEARDPQS